MAKKKWVQEAIQSEGRVRKHFGVKEGEAIPSDRLNAEIARLHKKTQSAGGSGLSEEEQSLLAALNLAKRMRGFAKRGK
jgi:hypothetical protein